MSITAVIRGGGDLGTGVAYHLQKIGVNVIITELANPKMVRHTVCLGYAVYTGIQQVEDITAELTTLDKVTSVKNIPVIIDTENTVIDTVRPDILCDCRMLKYDLPDQRDLAPLVVGLGPGFVAESRWPQIAGVTAANDGNAAGTVANVTGTVDFVIETQRGAHLGDVIANGRAIPNTGVPGVLGGESVRRLLHAPKAGTFRGVRHVGDLVEAGDIVGYVDEAPVIVAISGLLRGLVHDGLVVREREKIGDCDPRGAAVSAYKISDKSHKIGESVAGVCRQMMISLEKK